MFKKLFSPMKIGKVEIPNRLVVSPMITDYCNQDGTATERYIVLAGLRAFDVSASDTSTTSACTELFSNSLVS